MEGRRKRRRRSSQPVEPPPTPTTFKERYGKTELGLKILAHKGDAGRKELRKLATAAGIGYQCTDDTLRQRLYDAGVHDDETAKLHVAKTAADAAKAAAAAFIPAVDFDELAEKIALPSLLKRGEPVPELIKKYWHACYCYGELLRTLAPAAFATFCDEHAEVVKLLGMRLTMLPIMRPLLESLCYKILSREEVLQHIDVLGYTSHSQKLTNMAAKARGDALPNRPGEAREISVPLSRRVIVLRPFDWRDKHISGALIMAGEGDVDGDSNCEYIAMMRDQLEHVFSTPVPKDSCYNLGILSPVWEQLRRSGLTFVDFAYTDAPHAEVRVSSCFQGDYLIGGSHGYVYRLSNGHALFFITEVSGLITDNLDRLTEDQLGGAAGWEGLHTYLTSVEGGLMSQNKPRTDSIVTDCSGNAYKIYAVTRCLDELRERRDMDQMPKPPAPEKHPILKLVEQNNSQFTSFLDNFQREYDRLRDYDHRGVCTVGSMFREDSLQNFWCDPNLWRWQQSELPF